ncbi:MAG TPA: diguanylate cyclase [Janthinobacterium sp.]|nr:diguanylate cyclase [Janthinobacterium sp.]
MIAATRTARSLASRLYRAILLPAFALVLLAILWTAVVYRVEQERLSALNDAVAHSQSLARTLADRTNNMLRQADHATQLFKLQFEETGGALRLREFTRKNGLLDSVLPPKLDLPIAVLDASGNLADSSGAWLPDKQAGADYFRKHAGSAVDSPLFGTPVTQASTHKWLVRVSRRLNDRQGNFAGVIVIMLDPAYFVDDYDRLNVDEDGALLLISRDTGLAVGRAGETPLMSDKIDFAAPSGPGHPAEEVVLRQPFDGVMRIYSARELPRYGLLAVTGVARPQAMAKFQHHRNMYFGAVAAITLLIVVCVALLMGQSQRLRRSMLEAREAQAMLHAAASGSLDAVLLLKAWRAPGQGPGQMIEDFVCVDLNQRAADMIGKPREDILGQKICELLPVFRQACFFGKYARVLESGQTEEDEFEPQLPGGEKIWLQHQVVAIDDGVAVTSRDITQRKRDELERRQNQAELAAVNDASPLGLAWGDSEARCTYVNRTFEAITGLTRAEALGEGWMRAVHPDDRALLAPALEQLRRTRQPFQAALRCRHRDGKVVWVSLKIAAIVIDGAIEGYVGSIDDITTLRSSEVALQESEARLRTIADTVPAMIAYLDAGEVYRFHNIAYEKEFGRHGVDIHGCTLREAVGEAHYRQLHPYIERVLAGETLRFEESDDAAGNTRCMEVNYIPQHGKDGSSVVGFHVMRQDITMQKREKERLLKLSQVDALTGLTNRAGFLQKLGEAMICSRDGGSMMAVMYMDIDRFKPVNDTYGHNVGDALLKAFSARLSHTMRASDTIARLGGDEFTIIMEKVGKLEDATMRAARIIAAMQAQFDLDGSKVNVSASIGLSFYRGEDISPAALLKQADILLYRAKQGGRNTYRAATLAEMAAGTSDAA